MLAHTLPLKAETVPLAAALGRTLAADVVARDPLPPFPASMMVRSAPGDVLVCRSLCKAPTRMWGQG